MTKFSFTSRVLAISFLLLALPLLLYSFIFFQRSYREALAQAKTRIREISNFRTAALSETLPSTQNLLQELEFFLTEEKKKEKFTPEALTAKLEEVSRGAPNFQLFILEPQENERYFTFATGLPLYYKNIYHDYTLGAALEKNEKVSFVRYFWNSASRSYTLFLVMAKTFGNYVLLEALNIQSEVESVLAEVSNGERIDFAFLNADGVVFASTFPTLNGNYFDTLDPSRKKEILKGRTLGPIPLSDQPLPIIRGEDPLFFEFIFNNKIQIAYRSFVPGLDVSIVAFSSKEALFGKALARFLILYIMYGLILIVGGIVTYWLSSWISSPLKQLSRAMEEVSKGNLAVRFKEEPLGFEINLLGRIFNNTLDNLLEHTQRTENERVKKETYEKEVAIARSVQKNLLPAEMPFVSGIEILGGYLPAKEVGGDFYTAFMKKSQEEEHLFLGVTDVAGKGISSQIYALSFRSLLIANSHLYEDVGEILSETNRAFLEDAAESGMFLSTTFGSYRPKWKILSYISCGNTSGMVRRANGHLTDLEHSGGAVGLQPTHYVSEHIQLYAGDLVIFFTKGLIEATDEKGERFSRNRLKNLIQKRNWESAHELVSAIQEEVQKLTHGAEKEQEATWIILRIGEGT